MEFSKTYFTIETKFLGDFREKGKPFSQQKQEYQELCERFKRRFDIDVKYETYESAELEMSYAIAAGQFDRSELQILEGIDFLL